MASKQPRRSHQTSKFNSVTSITYVTMLLWPLNATSDSLLLGGGLSSIDLRGFAAGNNSSFIRTPKIMQKAPQVVVDLEESDDSGESELVHLLNDAGPSVLEHDDVGESRKVPLGIRVRLVLLGSKCLARFE